MKQPRILTFNFHEPYMCMMARTGFEMDVGMYKSGSLHRPWYQHYRAIPENLHLVEEEEWRAALSGGDYDVVIAHNEMNALDVAQAPAARILVCHCRLSFLKTTAETPTGDPLEALQRLVRRLAGAFSFVFVSESKQDEYGVPGVVIPPGLDVDEWGGYTGEEACVLRVGNLMRERRFLSDMPFQDELVGALPSRIVGDNPSIPNAAPAQDLDDLKRLLRGYRCLLHVTRQEFEDGYNLSMLEAMACGMPVVAAANRTCPITDSVNGYVSHSTEYLHRCLERLLEDPAHARELGARGRELVAERFPMDAFVQRWREMILACAEDRHPPLRQPVRPPRRNIVLHYAASPIAIGRSVEEAARHDCDLLTAGSTCSASDLAGEGFQPPYPAFRPQQIELAPGARFADLAAALPRGFVPELYCWIDSGVQDLGPDFASLPTPKIGWFIEPGGDPAWRVKAAREFGLVFAAQQEQVRTFQQAGVHNVTWLPLACSPSLHKLPLRERALDVAYAGRTDADDTQRDLFAELAGRWPNSRFGPMWPPEMAETYAASKIVVNLSPDGAVTGTVFDALAAGALLITEEAEGLDELLTPGEHCVTFRRPAEAFELIAHYLAHPEEREGIAAAGREHVLANHTYLHRTRLILEMARQQLGAFMETSIEAPLFSAIGGRLRLPYNLQRAPRKEGMLDAAEAAFNAGEFQKAYAISHAAAEENPGRRAVLMGRALTALGEPNEARAVFEEAMTLAPHALLRAEYGVLLVSLGQTTAAIELLQAGLHILPTHDRARAALGLAHMQEGDMEQAFQELETALRATFAHAGLLQHLVRAARAAGKLREAESVLRSYAAFYPGKADILWEHGKLLAGLGHYDAARQQLERMLVLAPDHEEAQALLDALQRQQASTT